jgi:hypothetical protein
MKTVRQKDKVKNLLKGCTLSECKKYCGVDFNYTNIPLCAKILQAKKKERVKNVKATKSNGDGERR